MQPQYPTQPMPQYPTQPQATYPQQQQQFAPPAPAYPVAPAYPQQPQGYPQQYAPQPAYNPAPAPAAPLPAGTLDGFYEQPSSGGGPSFKFIDANRQPQIGKSYVGIVARPVTNADVRPQTDNNGTVKTYKDGRPKFVLVVPMQVQPSMEFPEGVAGWWVKGQARDELARAMSGVGAPAGPPEAGAAIRVTLVGTRPVPGMNPAYQYRVEYVRPNGAAAVAPATVQALPPVQPVQQPTPMPAQQPVMQPAPAPAQMPMPQQAPVAQAPQAASAGFSPEQAELFAKLTGGQQAA